MDEKDKKIARLEKELRETKIALFVAVRNTTALPMGLLLGKSEKEISAKTFDLIEEMKRGIDYDKVEGQLMNLSK